MLSSSAAMNKDIMQQLKVMIGCSFVQGYGQTEGSGSAFVSSIYDTVGGTNGGACNTLELKLVDLPEINYLTTDEQLNPEGKYALEVHSFSRDILKIKSKQTRLLIKMVGFILVM